MINKLLFEDGSQLVPGKVVAVGRNYAAHITEMQSEQTAEPVLFLKPSTALCDLSAPIIIPAHFGSVHHEIELAVCISETCSNIQTVDVEKHIAGFATALDLTLRDIQSKAKKAGLPWALAKGFNNACPVSTFYKRKLSAMQNAEITLHKNGTKMQHGNTNQMIFPIADLIAYISQYITLLPGDIILTGTPAGVGPLQDGDILKTHIQHLGHLETRVQSKEQL